MPVAAEDEGRPEVGMGEGSYWVGVALDLGLAGGGNAARHARPRGPMSSRAFLFYAISFFRTVSRKHFPQFRNRYRDALGLGVGAGCNVMFLLVSNDQVDLVIHKWRRFGHEFCFKCMVGRTSHRES